MTRKPTRAALHRLIAIHTRIDSARSALSTGNRIGGKLEEQALAKLGITDLPEIVERLKQHLDTIKAHACLMFPEIYPQQPGQPGTNT